MKGIQLGILSALGAVVLLAMGCGGDTLDTIKESRELRIGVSQEIPPFCYVDSRGELAGFEVLLGRKLAKDLLGDEKRAKLLAVHSAKALQLLERKELDLLITAASARESKPKELAKITAATPYLYATTSVLGRADKPSGIQALLNAPVLVRKDSRAQAYFQANYPQIPLQICENLRGCLGALERGDSDYFAEADAILAPLARQNPSLTLSIAALGDPYPLSPLLRSSDPSLLAWLNKELAILQKEGFLEQALEAARESYHDESRSTYDRYDSPKALPQGAQEP